jgi:exosortase D (VPLPA-CTERM-specific)
MTAITEARSPAGSIVTVLLAVAGVAALLVWANFDALDNLVTRWRFEPEYNFGPMVVALVAYLLWARWPSMRERLGGSPWPGFIVLVAGLAMCFFGEAGESYYAQQLGFFTAIFGAGMAMLGARTFWILAPLLVMVLLTVPLPYTLQAIVTVKLQLISSQFGVAVVRLLGIPVFLSGNVIDLGVYQLQVAEACSGLRYLFPFICLSFLLAYLYEAPMWKRAIVFMMGVPVPIFLNGVRIASTAVMVNSYGIEMAEGFIHYFEGWVVFLAGMLLMLLVMLALEGFRLSRINLASLSRDESPASVGAAVATAARQPGSTGVAVAAVALTALATGATAYIHHAAQTVVAHDRQAFAMFPMAIDGWQGKANVLDENVIGILKSSDYLAVDYKANAGSSQANIFVAYYESLSKGAAIHSPRVCLPGDGWEIATLEQRPFSQIVDGLSGDFNRVVIQKGRTRLLVYYWYQQGGDRVASEFNMKFNLLWDRLSASVRDGAMVRLTVPIDGDGAAAEQRADETLKTFARSVLPQLDPFLPTAVAAAN